MSHYSSCGQRRTDCPWAETWRRIWGDQKFFRGPISGKISILRVKISDDLFLVIDLVLRIFPFFSPIFRMFTMLNVVYDDFLTRKLSFFTLFILSRRSDNTTSQNIGGTNAWAVPPPQILGGTVPPVPPRSPPLGITRPILRRSGKGMPIDRLPPVHTAQDETLTMY